MIWKVETSIIQNIEEMSLDPDVGSIAIRWQLEHMISINQKADDHRLLLHVRAIWFFRNQAELSFHDFLSFSMY
jgi:hypothetical protein